MTRKTAAPGWPADGLDAVLAPLRGRAQATLVLGDRTVRFSHPDKAMFPTDESKLDLLRYHLEVAPVLLRHLEARPLTFTRYPHGIGGRGFFQKRPPAGTPPWLDAAVFHGVPCVLAHTAAELALFVQWGTVEIHTPLLRLDRGDVRVDQLVIDLDPMPPAAWKEVSRAARGVRLLLEHAGVRSYPKLSGKTGLHVFVPLRPRPGGMTTAAIARGLADLLAAAAPDLYTVVWPVKARHGVYVDHSRNAPGQTMAAAYSVRAEPGAPVSAPVEWDEVFDLGPQAFTIHNLPERLARTGDLFAPTLGPPEPIAALEDLARTARRCSPARSAPSTPVRPGRPPAVASVQPQPPAGPRLPRG